MGGGTFALIFRKIGLFARLFIVYICAHTFHSKRYDCAHCFFIDNQAFTFEPSGTPNLIEATDSLNDE